MNKAKNKVFTPPIIIELIVIITFVSLIYLQDNVSFSDAFFNFSDYITSVFFFIIMIFFTLSHLSNRYVWANEMFRKIIESFMKVVPKDIILGKKITNYLSSLIKNNKKIIIFMPYTSPSNKESLLLQLVGFLEVLDEKDEKDDFILKTPTSSREDKFGVEIVFVKENSDDITSYFKEQLESHNNYIIITAMSEIYKNAIAAKKILSKDEQDKLKIIGVLSSISVNIENDINKDEDIIRVYPPDYDEAKIAITFLMSRVKNNICHIPDCHYKSKKSNIIILHTNEYGEAVKSRSKEFYELAMRDILKNTSTNLSTFELEECISFYSFTYKNENFHYDFIDDHLFDEHIEKWEEEGSTNYFFFIGYQPNISKMIDIISSKIKNKLNDYCYLFSSPMSMDIWRDEACISLEKNNVTEVSYYLSANTYDKVDKHINMKYLLKKYENTRVKKVGNKNEIKAIAFSALFDVKYKEKDIYFGDLVENDRIEEFKRNNFIGTFAKLGVSVAREYVETENKLLICKQKVFEKEGIDLKLLINGDSIDNFTINLLNCDRISDTKSNKDLS